MYYLFTIFYIFITFLNSKLYNSLKICCAYFIYILMKKIYMSKETLYFFNKNMMHSWSIEFVFYFAISWNFLYLLIIAEIYFNFTLFIYYTMYLIQFTLKWVPIILLRNIYVLCKFLYISSTINSILKNLRHSYL